MLDRAARLTPGGLRAAIARAVIKAAPKKAKERRETAAKDARVERWLQDTGNAALMGCELPPAEALAADEQITARAKELRAAGLEGDMDQLRARAYLDLLLGKDSRPGPEATAAAPGGAAPAGFAGRVTLTVPLATLAGLADRPGELGSLGPVDPWLARDLAAAAAREPEDHLVPDRHRQPGPRRRPRLRPARTQGSSETRRAGATARRDRVLLHPGRPGRPARRARHLAARTPGPGPDLIITIDPITTDPCDHRFESKVMIPGLSCGTCPRSGTPPAPAPICRRPAARADFEHNTPYEAGGRTCLCNTGPKCRHDHRLKQHPRWKVDQLPDGTFTWTTPAGRTYTTEPTRYPSQLRVIARARLLPLGYRVRRLRRTR